MQAPIKVRFAHVRIYARAHTTEGLRHCYLHNRMQNVYIHYNLSYFILFILIEKQNVQIMSTII